MAGTVAEVVCIDEGADDTAAAGAEWGATDIALGVVDMQVGSRHSAGWIHNLIVDCRHTSLISSINSSKRYI